MGNQSELKFPQKRAQMAQALVTLASKVNYIDLFATDSIAERLISEVTQVSYRRFVISSPRDNNTEAFRFSSRHSEFVKLEAEALVATSESLPAAVSGTVDEFRRQYKVVLEYPDKTSSYSMLQVLPPNKNHESS